MQMRIYIGFLTSTARTEKAEILYSVYHGTRVSALIMLHLFPILYNCH